MHKIRKLLVVVGKDEDTLHPELDWDRIKESLSVDMYHICDEAVCIQEDLPDAAAVIQFAGFEKPYSWTSELAAAQWGAPPVFYIEPGGAGFCIRYGKRKEEGLAARTVPDALRMLYQEGLQEYYARHAAFLLAAFLAMLCVILIHGVKHTLAQDPPMIEVSE